MVWNKFFLIFAFFATCSKTELKQTKPTILVSISPYKGFVEKIAGDDFEIEVIVPEGTNPHAYEPTPRQIQTLAKGSIWFQVGESFEKKLLPVLKEKTPSLEIVDLTKEISLIKGSCCQEEVDRHVWLSIKNLKKQAKTIQGVLEENFSSREFASRTDVLIRDLDILDIKIKTSLKENTSFVVAHPAFGYFCRDYGTKQLSIEFEGKEPTAKHLTEMIHKALELKTHLAISVPEHPSKGVDILSSKLDLDVHEICPYSENFLQEMEKLAQLLGEH